MKRIEADILIVKLFENQLSIVEADRLENWLREEKHLAYFNHFVGFHQLINEEVDFDYKRSLRRVHRAIEIRQRRRRLRNTFKYAATLLVLLIGGYLLFNTLDNTSVETVGEENEIFEKVPIIVNNNIQKGKSKAILTLDSGEEIHLQQGEDYSSTNICGNGEELKYTASDDTKNTNKEIRHNLLTVPRGGQFTLTLADGTRIWLNSASQLRYPKDFRSGEIREVELVYGEAYFEVSPSTEHGGDRFKVKVNEMEAEVLGTEFNIKAYSDEKEIYTTLVNGKVALRGKEQKDIVLKPYEQAILEDTSSHFEVKKLSRLNVILWREGIFSFDDKPLKEILKTLSRWYDMEVYFVDSKKENVRFTGVLGKDQSIVEIMNILKITDKLNYEINDKSLTIK